MPECYICIACHGPIRMHSEDYVAWWYQHSWFRAVHVDCYERERKKHSAKSNAWVAKIAEQFQDRRDPRAIASQGESDSKGEDPLTILRNFHRTAWPPDPFRDPNA